MKQIIQDFKTGEMKVLEIAAPQIEKGFVLVNNYFSVVSIGTERGTVATAQKNLIGKAYSRPDLVRQVVNQIQKKGLKETLEKVKSKLDSFKALGYSSAGRVVAVGDSVEGIKVGDLVACAGSGYASHAEIVSVPKNLVVKIPDDVTCEQAAFTTVGSIALQGVRQAEINLGDKVCVIGLGLIGLITVQMLKAAGAAVLGIDLHDFVLIKAGELGCDVVVNGKDSKLSELCKSFTNAHGFDKVIVTASSKTAQPVELAGDIARDRGTVILVGAVGMDFPRQPYYDKELNIKMSRSYGPGRYDADYEEKGQDYPLGYVRWTENRNMQAFLDLVAMGSINLKPLITHQFTVDEAEEAYSLVTGKSKDTPLGILIKYNENAYRESGQSEKIILKASESKKEQISVAVIGAGNFAQTSLLPNIAKHTDKNVKLNGIVTAHGYTAKRVADKYKVDLSSTNPGDIFENEKINTVFIATRHNQHTGLLLEALKNQQHVYLEKPLAITFKELNQIHSLIKTSKSLPVFTVGYNRRYSDLIFELKRNLINRQAPLCMNYRINAGYLPDSHWTQDREVGGGRIIGEVCHFVDLLSFLCGNNPKTVYTSSISKDSLNIALTFADNSIANLSYWANGNDKVEKEYLEVFSEGQSFVLKDFRNLIFYSGKKSKKINARGGRDIGRSQIVENFFDSIISNKFPIEPESLLYTSLTCFMIEESMRRGNKIDIDLKKLTKD